MKTITKRIEKLESLLKENGTDDIERLTPEERHRRIAELSYMNGSYNGYVFKSLEEYDSMTGHEQTEYIREVSEVLEPWLEEKKRTIES